MSFLNRFIRVAQAHCDVPCGIYDPAGAQTAALSVVRFLDLIAELEAEAGGQLSVAQTAKLARLVEQKETHAKQVKDEVVIIWGDYIKAPQIEAFPEVHSLTHSIMLQASKCKQEVAQENGLVLLALVNEFATVFWKTKGVETELYTAPGKPGQAVVRPKG